MAQPYDALDFADQLTTNLNKLRKQNTPKPLGSSQNVPESKPLMTPTGMPSIASMPSPLPSPGGASTTSMLPPGSPPPTPMTDLVNRGGLSNSLAVLARAIGPNSFGGRLGEGVLEMNQANLENAQRNEVIQENERMREFEAARLSSENQMVPTPLGPMPVKYAHFYMPKEGLDNTPIPASILSQRPELQGLTIGQAKSLAPLIKPAGASSFQDIGTTKEGLTVSYDPKKGQRVVTMPDGTMQNYNKSLHGDIFAKTAGNPSQQLTPEAIQFEAEKYLQTGQLPATGMAGAGKMQILSRAAELAKEQGLTGKEATIKSALYKANSEAIKNDTKQYDLMHKAELQADKAADLLRQSSAAYGRTNIRFVNSLEAMARGAATDPKLADLQMKLLAFSREYYKVVTNAYASVQELSVGAQAQADKLLSTSDSWASLDAKIAAAKQEMANTNLTFKQTLDERQSAIGSGTTTGGGMRQPQAAPTRSRDISSAVKYLKVDNRNDALARARELIKKGWTKDEINQAAKQAGF